MSITVITNPLILEKDLSIDPISGLSSLFKDIFYGASIIGPEKILVGDVPYELLEWKIIGLLSMRLLIGKSNHILSVKFIDGKFWILSEDKNSRVPVLHDYDLTDLEYYADQLRTSCNDEIFYAFSDSSEKLYQVDTKKVTCTCSNFTYRCSHYTPDREERLCKHLSQIYSTYPELLPKTMIEIDSNKGPKDADGKTRYPRAVFDMYVSEVKSVLKQFNSIIEKYEVCGSYRRLCQRVSDLDFLIVLKDGESWDPFLNYLESTMGYKLIEDIGRGDCKAAYRVDGYVHIDFKAVDKINWPFALLHFTGSKSTNINMRRKANSMGYKLNEYGLFKESNGEAVTGLLTEKDVFKYLELDYKEPWDR